VSLALFAEKPDAFIEMAVDLSFILPAEEGRVRLDDTMTPDLTPGIRGLSDLTHLNRAVGVLIAEGHTQTWLRPLGRVCSAGQLTSRTVCDRIARP
jgi:hypothetical protein